MPNQSLFDVAYPQALREAEARLFKNRPKWQKTDPEPQLVGMAISSGGIRSATFSLGVFQTLAKLKLLGEIDYISSVSGGGYFSGLYGRIFTREDVHNISEVEEILSPDRAGQSLDPGPENWKPGLFRWVRENGRYLAPKGGGDLLLGLAVMFRNWVSLEIVMMIFVLAILLLGQLLRAAVETRFPFFADWTALLVTGPLWWSSLILLAGAILLLVALPLGSAYWLIPQPGPEESPVAGKQSSCWPPFAVLFLVAVVASAYLLLPGLGAYFTCGWLKPERICQSINCGVDRWIAWLAVVVCGLAFTSWIIANIINRCTLTKDANSGVSSPANPDDPQTGLFRNERSRNWLSAMLRTALAITFAIAAIALIDSCGQTIYVAYLAGRLHPAKWIVGLFGPVGAIAPFAKWIASMITGDGKGKRYSPPLKVLAGVGAAIVIIPVLIGLDWVSYSVAFGGALPPKVPQAVLASAAPVLSPGSLTVNSEGISFKCGAVIARDSCGSGAKTASPQMEESKWARFCRLGLTLTGAAILSWLFGQTWPFINRSSLATI
jgi:hypothetical protein